MIIEFNLSEYTVGSQKVQTQKVQCFVKCHVHPKKCNVQKIKTNITCEKCLKKRLITSYDIPSARENRRIEGPPRRVIYFKSNTPIVRLLNDTSEPGQTIS